MRRASRSKSFSGESGEVIVSVVVMEDSMDIWERMYEKSDD